MQFKLAGYALCDVCLILNVFEFYFEGIYIYFNYEYYIVVNLIFLVSYKTTIFMRIWSVFGNYS
ncbi:hypothetical protein GCM10025791_37730 [Halioxenophilus aromaticivorans]|uniref:Uncharacterized protein n=1 Tax=Halioxenophilus aromaticivorans TaxID=1306992 RepID=A0AAV3U799_9ALTE